VTSDSGAFAALPVTVLTGFLGSGKTTLLTKLLAHADFADTAVIVNEFGEVGLDHALVAEGDENVVLLDAGCLCCTVANSLGETLNDLFFRRAKGELPPFRRAIIETTGLADPAPILHLLMRDRVVTPNFRLDGVVTTVDALHGAGQLDDHPEALKQAAVADRLVLTKTDLAAEPEAAALKARLHDLNPGAALFEAVKGALAPGDVLDVGPFDLAGKPADVAGWLGAEANDHNHAEVNRHSARIQAFCFALEGPVSWAGYAAWVELMRRFRGENLLRVKGVIAIEGARRPYLVQGVQHVFDNPVRLESWPWADRRPRLVVIARDLGRAELERSLAALRAPAGTMGPASLEELASL
jgi:G3E family GTPase